METAGRYLRTPACHTPHATQLRLSDFSFLSCNSLHPGRPFTTYSKDDDSRHRLLARTVAGSHCRHGEMPRGRQTLMGDRVRANNERRGDAREVCDMRSSPRRQMEVRAGNAAEKAEGVVKRLAVFVSGGGSNLKSIHEASVNGTVSGQVVLVVSDKPGCGGWQFAEDNGIDVLPFPRGKFAPDGLSPEEIVLACRNLGVDFIVLAGYLRLLPSTLVAAYPRAVLNIHPALLPAFGGRGYFGLKVHQAVIKSGARFSGATVHFVDEAYDNGPIVAQQVVPVLPSDSPQDLQQRVLMQEHVLYQHVVAALCDGRVTWREDGVPLISRSWEEETEFL